MFLSTYFLNAKASCNLNSISFEIDFFKTFFFFTFSKQINFNSRTEKLFIKKVTKPSAEIIFVKVFMMTKKILIGWNFNFKN